MCENTTASLFGGHFWQVLVPGIHTCSAGPDAVVDNVTLFMILPSYIYFSFQPCTTSTLYLSADRVCVRRADRCSPALQCSPQPMYIPKCNKLTFLSVTLHS